MPPDSTADDHPGHDTADSGSGPDFGPDFGPDSGPDSGLESGLLGRNERFGFAVAAPNPDRLIGRDLGGVTIVRRLGDGGMGRVYEGRQRQPHRAVAVKVIRPGVVTPGLQKRFEYEAQLAGRLSHPGIAQIHSVGLEAVDGTDVPFFVMELVSDASPLTDYAAAHNLPTHERVALFRKACEAVGYGHHKGIIHRDLKPGNILVDTAGQPKIIDFGVARSTDSDIALTSMHTDVGHLLGTLQYMSPEQFDADPDGIDIRTDVYALGVVLYELLTGQPPYDVRTKPVFEAARMVREVAPVPLSSFNKTLRGDLETIAATCLEKERGRRYSSAAELEADLGRYLAGEPIAAAPVGLLESLTRLGRRHRIAVMSATAVVCSLIAATAGIGMFAVRAEHARAQAVASQREAQQNERLAVQERDRAADQEQLARQEQARSQRLLDFLLDAFRSANAFAGGGNLTVMELLGRAGQKVPESFRDDPYLQADILQTIGQVLQYNGDYRSAEPLLAQAVAVLEQQIDSGASQDQDRLAGALEALGAFYRATRQYDKALPLLERASELAEQRYGADDIRTAGLLGTLAGLYHERGDVARAETLYRRQLAMYVAAHGERHESTAAAMTHVGCTLATQGQFARAEELFRTSLALTESLMGADTPRVAEVAMHLGVVLRLQRRLPEARRSLERALDIAERNLGKEHTITSEVLGHIGALDAREGRHAEAARCFERAVAIREQAFGADHPGLVGLLESLTSEYEALNRPEDAEKARARARAIADRP